MSLDLKDLRAKVTPEAWAFLQGRAEAEHKEMAELVRDILTAWAHREAHAFTVAQRFLRAEGLPGTLSGESGRNGERA